MSQLDTLLAAVGAAPALPGARCRGKHHLFDERQRDEPPEVAEQRHAQALGLCRLCPALASCETWFNALTPSKRPTGVVAGKAPRPRPTGRPHQPSKPAGQASKHSVAPGVGSAS